MSMHLRPVIQYWGESLTYSSREPDMADVLVILARHAGAGRVDRTLYGDLRVICIQRGGEFLNYLGSAGSFDMFTMIVAEGESSSDVEERERLLQDVRDLKGMAEAWRMWIDDDGTLRFYCD